jgi:tRNA (guanine26-N2/guanine27-N2)-dimethyltransferase
LRYATHVEGGTRLLVPAGSLDNPAPPTFPVFFNPAARLNRDFSVAMARATRPSTFCDSMAGVGSRGLRVAVEGGGRARVTMVDFNRRALGAARRAAALNRVKGRCEFAAAETSSYLHSRFGKGEKFDAVDVDPFGTPVRQVPAALGATSNGGVLSVTATDTAVLCGVYPEVCLRRYGAEPLNNHFHHETAARILIGYIARVAASLDTGVRAVAAHANRHYVRVYVRVAVGARKADSSLRNLGYVSWCPGCGHASAAREKERACLRCGKRPRVAGPLWLGGVAEGPTVAKASKAAAEMGLAEAAGVLDPLSEVDAFPPWSFSLEQITSSLGVASVPESGVRGRLEAAGHRTMRQPFEVSGLKTGATYDEVVEAVRGADRGRALPGNRFMNIRNSS